MKLHLSSNTNGKVNLTNLQVTLGLMPLKSISPKSSSNADSVLYNAGLFSAGLADFPASI